MTTYEPKPGDVFSYAGDALGPPRFIPEDSYSDPFEVTGILQFYLHETIFLILEVFPGNRRPNHKMAHVLLDDGNRGLLFFDTRAVDRIHKASGNNEH